MSAAALRATEARRQLALKAIAEDADARLAMTAWLPIEARPTLEAAARGSRAEDPGPGSGSARAVHGALAAGWTPPS
ncbi:MAG: hypothetical protein R3F43_11645 [bacterium]